MTTIPDNPPDSPHSDAVRRFWARLAPKFGYPPALDRVTLVSESGLAVVVHVAAGDVLAVVRWPPGSLLRVDRDAVQSARLSVLAAEVGFAPEVLFWEQGALELGGQPVVVSACVPGDELAADWFRGNIRQAAALLARLHRDDTLSDALEKIGRGDPRVDCLAAGRAAWAAVQDRLVVLEARPLPPELAAFPQELGGYVRWFGTQIQAHLSAFQGQRVGPVHGDVNSSNWLLDGDNRVYLVDWDRARLDDPALDVGMLLHWYVPSALWPVFVREYGQGGALRVDGDALLARARVRYALHAADVCAYWLERAADGVLTPADALVRIAPFMQDLRRMQAGTFGTR